MASTTSSETERAALRYQAFAEAESAKHPELENVQARPVHFVRQLIEQSSAAKGVDRRSLTRENIQRRALLAMVNEAALLLAEEVTSRATDVDVVMVNGYGFPRARGGPIFWARQQGEQELEDSLEWLGRSSGPGFIRGNTRYLRSGS